MRIVPFLCFVVLGCVKKIEETEEDSANAEIVDDTGATPDCGDDETNVGYMDEDGDGYGASNTRLAQCDPLPDGYVESKGDCDDDDPTRYPNADEICDGRDNDCDGATDEDAVDKRTFYLDEDGDGYGVDTNTIESCTNTAEDYVPYGGDCNDDDETISPAHDEICDGIDNDCNGTTDVDAIDMSTWHPDNDGDGHGDIFSSLEACDQPDGAVAEPDDCDDTSDVIYVEAPELCDGINNDCDAYLDEGCDDDTGGAEDDTGGTGDDG